MTGPFDRRLLARRRERAAASFDAFDFLIDDVAERLADRLADFTQTFPLAVDLGCHTGQVGRCLAGRGGIRFLVPCDAVMGMARRAGPAAAVADEEALPFAAGSLDAVLSSLSLHMVNDLPGTLVQIRRALKPDGLFLAALFGGQTLRELRQAFAEAELAVDGGVSPRVAPFADVRDLGDLLQRAGFALPIADSETLTVNYSDPLRLLADLRGMGQGNVLAERRRTPLRRATLAAALERYRELFAGEAGQVPATFEVVFLTARAPHADQAQPLRPGSAARRLSDALDSEEIPAGDSAKP